MSPQNWFQNRRAKAKQQRKLEDAQRRHRQLAPGAASSFTWLAGPAVERPSMEPPTGPEEADGVHPDALHMPRAPMSTADRAAAEVEASWMQSWLAAEAALVTAAERGPFPTPSSENDTLLGHQASWDAELYATTPMENGTPATSAGASQELFPINWPAGTQAAWVSSNAVSPLGETAPCPSQVTSSIQPGDLRALSAQEVSRGQSSSTAESPSTQDPSSGPELGSYAMSASSSISLAGAVAMGSRQLSTVSSVGGSCGIVPQVPSVRVPSPASTTLDLAARRKRPRPATLGRAALTAPARPGLPSSSPTSTVFVATPSSPAPRTASSAYGRKPALGRARKARPASHQRSPLNVASFAEASAAAAAEIDAAQAGNRKSAGNAAGTTARPVFVQASSASLRGKPPPPTPSSMSEHESFQTGMSEGAEGSEWPWHAYSQPTLAFSPSLPLSSSLASPPITPHDALWPGYGPVWDVLDRSPIGPEDPLSMSQLSAATDDPIFSPHLATFAGPIQMPQPLYVMPRAGGDLGPADHLGGIDTNPSTQRDGLVDVGDGRSDRFVTTATSDNRKTKAHTISQFRPAATKPKSYIFANSTPADF